MTMLRLNPNYLPLSGGTINGNLQVAGTLTQNGTAVSLSGHTHNYAAASHTHSVSQLTWAKAVNLTCTSDANDQEWSIDLNSGSYTGCYWHVWSGKLSKSILACYNDDAHVNIGGACNVAGTITQNGTAVSLSGHTHSNYVTTNISGAAVNSDLDVTTSGNKRGFRVNCKCTNPGSSLNNHSLSLGVGADGIGLWDTTSNKSLWTASLTTHTHSYLPLSGGTVTADIALKGAKLNRDAANPSSDAWGSFVSWTDTDNERVGFIAPVRRTNGKIELCFRVFNENTSGSEEANNFSCCVDRAGNATYWVSNTANFRSAIGAAASSDRRLKTDIQPLGDDAVDFIRELEPSSYWINGEKQVGLIAQNVKAADRWDTRMAFETVEEIDGLDDWEKMPDGSPTWKLDYIRLLPPTIAALQKALDKIDLLEARISDLELQLGA